MKPSNFRLFSMLFLGDPTTKKFLLGVWIGLAFSIAVILSTIGIMDGFNRALREGLKKSSGDGVMQSRHGFFSIDKKLQAELDQELKKELQENYVGIVQTESFLIFNDESRGVIVKGIDDDYGQIVGLPLHLREGGVAIGEEIGRINKIKVGDEIVLSFGKGGVQLKNMPSLLRFRVDDIITHGVYQKDARLVYIRLIDIQKILGVGDRVNMVAFNVHRDKNIDNDLLVIENKLAALRTRLDPDFYFKPYWREFAPLIEAVQAEKVLISLILQLIVVISIFNVLAFIYFINEKKAKELFLFKALGLSKKGMSRLWLQLVGVIWLAGCLLAVIFVYCFKFLLKYLPFFKLPAEIYYMPRMDLFLSWKDYGFVFGLALLWMLVITYYLLRKMRHKSLLEGLRQEFV